MELRRIGAFTAACLLVSNTVGSGIFTTTGFLARDLGDPLTIVLVWLFGGGLALAGAMSYAELGVALPHSGGEYVYLHRAYGPLAAFLSGWTSFAVGFGAAIAAAAVSFGAFVAELLPEVERSISSISVALLLVWTLTAVHARGVAHGAPVQWSLTAIKIGSIIALLVAGVVIGDGDWGHLSVSAERPSGFGSIFIALIFVSYAYSGWNAAVYVAGEVAEPQRNLPRALIGGTVIVVALYVALNLLYLYALPISTLARQPVLPVAEKAVVALFGTSAAGLFTAMLCAGIAAAASAMIWAGPRVYDAMACDGLAPADWRSHHGTPPRRAMVVQSLWVSLLIVSGNFEQLLLYAGVALSIFSALTVVALIVLRHTAPDLPRPFRVPLYPWLPVTYAVVSVVIAGCAFYEHPFESMLALATIAVGVPAYFVTRRFSSRTRSSTAALSRAVRS